MTKRYFQLVFCPRHAPLIDKAPCLVFILILYSICQIQPANTGTAMLSMHPSLSEKVFTNINDCQPRSLSSIMKLDNILQKMIRLVLKLPVYGASEFLSNNKRLVSLSNKSTNQFHGVSFYPVTSRANILVRNFSI